MKHAWLIIAHNEFKILETLISLLEDPAFDIFIHIDKKVKEIPSFLVPQDRLHIVEPRIDVRWGAPSQIDVELLLMSRALQHAQYDYFHIISGTHLPIKSNEYIQQYFETHHGKEIMHLWEEDRRDIGNKLQRYNFFVKGFSSRRKLIRSGSQLAWRIVQKIQKTLSVERYPDLRFYKSDNWVSLTRKAVQYLVQESGRIKKKYKYSYCGDEYFVATELMNHPDEFQIYDTSQLLMVEFDRYNPRTLTEKDLDSLLASDSLFARKFSEKEMAVVNQLQQFLRHEKTC